MDPFPCVPSQVNSGGPLETVVAVPGHPKDRIAGQTGFLCEPTADAFAIAMITAVTQPDVVRTFI